MAIFAKNWTGRQENNFSMPKHPFTIPGDADVLERPPLKSDSALTPKPVASKETAWLEEYEMLAKQVGIKPPHMKIEEFKQFLAAHDIPVFSLTEVTAYMDKKAAAESKDKAGWLWRPLRAKDNKYDMLFGRKAEHFSGHDLEPASDYYHGPHKERTRGAARTISGNGNLIGWEGSEGHEYTTNGGAVYDRTIPLHALRKAAIIDKHWKHDVALFVSDYAPAPEIQYPDPFLMAVIPNPEVNKGIGRFVIDFWDEPGFGLDKMLMP